VGKAKVEQPKLKERPECAIADALEKFLDSHMAAGHRIQMCLHPESNFFALFCTTCDPQMVDAFETRH
jgi:hypothetical protein